MFGNDDKKIVEIKTKPLNTYVVDCITEKREDTNKYSSGHDFTFKIQSDAVEEEFKRLLDEFIAENEDYYKDVYMVKFSVYLSNNGFYCFCQNRYYNRFFTHQKL